MPLIDRITAKTAPVGVIGLGYVGLPLAVTTARAGFPVTGFDVDATKMDRLDAGTSYIEAVSNYDLSDVAENFRGIERDRLCGVQDLEQIGAHVDVLGHHLQAAGLTLFTFGSINFINLNSS